jgi:hypothetical protein
LKDDDIEEQLRTLISMRVPESRIRFWRDLWYLFLILFFMGLGFTIFGAMQYWACHVRWPEKTFSQCMRFDIETKKGRR